MHSPDFGLVVHSDIAGPVNQSCCNDTASVKEGQNGAEHVIRRCVEEVLSGFSVCEGQNLGIDKENRNERTNQKKGKLASPHCLLTGVASCLAKKPC
jgi:hypothetical protein